MKKRSRRFGHLSSSATNMCAQFVRSYRKYILPSLVPTTKRIKMYVFVVTFMELFGWVCIIIANIKVRASVLCQV